MQDLKVGTETVATISLNAGSVSSVGEVQTDGSVYWAVVNGSSQGRAGKLGPAIEHLAILLAKSTRGQGPGWGLRVQCHRGGWGIVFGNLASGRGGGGSLPACVAKSIGSGPFTRVEEAIHAATRALRRCCA